MHSETKSKGFNGGNITRVQFKGGLILHIAEDGRRTR